MWLVLLQKYITMHSPTNVKIEKLTLNFKIITLFLLFVRIYQVTSRTQTIRICGRYLLIAFYLHV